MRRDDQRREQLGDREGAERALQAYDDEQQRHGSERLLALLAVPHRPNQQADDDQSQGAREIAMNHLVQRLAEIMVGLWIDVAVRSEEHTSELQSPYDL